MDDYRLNYGNAFENPPENRHETISKLIHHHSKYCSSGQGKRMYTSKRKHSTPNKNLVKNE
jgi:hypothetical protein